MDDDFAAQGGQRGAVIIEGTMNLGIRREFGVDAGGTEEVQGDIGLGNE